jgi:hypothetical protein
VNAEQLLQTHAEVAVALAGFASVAAVLRRPLSRRDRLAFVSILFSALIQVLGSLVPVWLSNASITADLLWRITAVLVLVLSIALVVWVYQEVKTIGGSVAGLINRPVTIISRLLTVGTYVALLANLVAPGFVLYYISLLSGLTLVFIMFADAVLTSGEERS